jgi:hypothetical protein
MTKFYKFTDINQYGFGIERYNCDPTLLFDDICVKDDKGYYKNKEACVNDCEGKYINHHLHKANIKRETHKFYLFIKHIIEKENIEVYIKGGNALGLKILKMIYEKYPEKEFEKHFNDFLKLELIKDWDFSAYIKDDKVRSTENLISNNNVIEEYRPKLDDIAEEYKLVPRAKTFILYQAKYPILTDGKPLFEISILDKDRYSNLEMPMSTMKVKITPYNIKYIFMFAKAFHMYKLNSETFDFSIIKRMISKLSINIFPHKNGLFLITPSDSKFDDGGLSKDMLDIIKKYEDFDVCVPQFLIMLIGQPNRIFLRLIDKNIPKNEKIKEFIKQHKLDTYTDWVFNSKYIMNIVDQFLKELGKKMAEIYVKNLDKKNDIESVKKALDEIIKFTEGIEFKRIEDFYKEYSPAGIELIKLLFKYLFKNLDKKQIESLEKSNKFYATLQFLYKNVI